MYSHLLQDEFLRYVYLIQIDDAQNVSHMCMCIEFVIQVPKQKNAHVSLSVGMVSLVYLIQTQCLQNGGFYEIVQAPIFVFI